MSFYAQAYCLSGLKVIKLYSCSTKQSMKFTLLINVYKARWNIWEILSKKNLYFSAFWLYEQLKFQAQLSMKNVL